MSTREMLRFLTHKLKSSSLNEVQPIPAQEVDDEDRDSGTESDDENNDYDDSDDPCDVRGTDSPVRNSGGTALDGRSNGEFGASTKTHEISDHNFDTVSCTSDYERQSLDFDRHSSEDELGSINKENVAEKRKWSTLGCDSASSSDEEVKELLFNPQPVLLSSSPPKGVLKIYTQNASPRQVLARMTPISVSAASPRKRHRHSATSDPQSDSEGESVIQRPCLDFEKMQQVRRLCPAYSRRCKISKSAKLQTV